MLSFVHSRPLWILATCTTIGSIALSARAEAQSPPGFESAWRGVEDWYVATLEEEGVVGSSLYMLRRGEILAHRHYGLAEAESHTPVDAETIYHWASITKTLTAVAIMQLRDRGLLALDDPIVRYVPELADVHNPYGSMEVITLRHLLSHSAGFRGSTWPWAGGEPWQPHEPTRWEQLVAMIPYTEIHFPPGSRFSYSNPGVIFLGRVIETLSGDDYEVYVDKNILKPLGMHRSYFDVTPYHLLPHRSSNYLFSEGERRALGQDFDTGITVSNGGLNAPIPDMARWVSFLLGATPASGSDVTKDWSSIYDGVLQRASLEEMFHRVVPIGDGGSGPESMGLSFFLLERGGTRYIGHTGSQRAFRTFFYMHPESGAAVIGAFNTARGGPDERGNTDRIRIELRERLFREVFPVFR